MPDTYPTFLDGAICRYPVRRSHEYSTRVHQFVSFQEQRWINRLSLDSFTFVYKNLHKTDAATLRDFFVGKQGRFGTFDVVFDGNTYSNMAFDQDEIVFEEDKPNRYSVTVKLKQVMIGSGALVVPTLTTYPTINSGVRVQRPWGNVEKFNNAVVDIESGFRYSYAWLLTQLKRWELNYPVITDAERDVLLGFFNQMRGRFGEFDFVDPEDDVNAPGYEPFHNCRFDADAFESSYEGPNHNSLRLAVVQYAS